MRMIMFEEKDVLVLLDRLKLAAFEDCGKTVLARVGQNIDPELLRQQLVNEIHRKFNYELVNWMQAQGASCVR